MKLSEVRLIAQGKISKKLQKKIRGRFPTAKGTIRFVPKTEREPKHQIDLVVAYKRGDFNDS